MNTQQIRREAAAVRARYTHETGERAGGLLPLDDLAERLFLLTAFDDPTLDPRINGELNATVGSIRLRPGMSISRRRFVVAHELGHYVLEGGEGGLFEDDDSTLDERAAGEGETERGVLRAYNTRERHEQEANQFALELLIPADALWQAVTQPGWTIEALARRFAVSTDALTTQLVNVCCLEPTTVPPPIRPQMARALAPDPQQQAAVDAPLPTLVVAGPGTGKTRSIVAKYLSLVAQGVDPATILALTFSNKAAEEMRERIVAALSREQRALAGRIEVSTFHAWGLNFLKSYGHVLGLPFDIQLRTTGNLFILLKRRLDDLPLEQFKSLHNPGYYLGDCLHAISRAKDELWTPVQFRTLAEAEGERIVAEAERKHAGKTTKTAQKARDDAARKAARLTELAAIYERYETLLREEGTLDYGDLIMRAVEALRVPEVAAELHARYAYILVDEFQDINYASGALVALLDGGRGRVWAVGDVWQSIYRFRGASPANLRDFEQTYPAVTTRSLQINYRSIQPILDASHAIMAADPTSATRLPQQARRSAPSRREAVVEWVAEDEDAEVAVIAHDILRRVGGSAPRCVKRHRPIQRRHASKDVHRSWRWRFGDHVVLCRKHAHAARVVAALEAHGIPVDWLGDIYDYPEVKDVLAICALVGSEDDASMLRALTLPEYALDPDDLGRLVRAAHASEQALPRAAHDAAIVASLSPAGQQALAALHVTLEALADAGDAWQVLTRYLFSVSGAMRERLVRASKGNHTARRELSTLGQLIATARTFVREAAPDERDAPAFITYVRLLIESGETPRAQPVAGPSDVVRVLTVHASKGLEFPIVYVPCLQEGQFPARPAPTTIPPVRDPAASDDSGGEEERYLLYVAMTRARDRLILSRSAIRKGKLAPRSSLLPGGADGTGAPWPVVFLPAPHGCPPTTRPSRLAAAPVVRDPLPASSVDTYETCPRRYFYQYGYQLYDDSSPYLRMHQAMREAIAALVTGARDGTLPADEDALREQVRSTFAKHNLPDVLYAHDYFDETLRHVQSVWDDLRTHRIAPDAANRTFILRRPVGNVSVRVDRVEQTAEGPRWIHARSGRERPDDHLSTRILLYALAYTTLYGRDAQIAIHYTATDTLREVKLRPDVLQNHTERLDTLLTALSKGNWEASPGAQCATCPFNLICPV